MFLKLTVLKLYFILTCLLPGRLQDAVSGPKFCGARVDLIL